MLNSRNIISWVQGNCFIARNNGPVFTVGPLITLLLSIALFGDYTWRRFNNDRSLEPSPFCIVEFSFIAKIMFSCNFFSRLKNGEKMSKMKDKRERRKKSRWEKTLWNENEKMVEEEKEEEFWKIISSCLTIKFHCSRRNIFEEKV